MRLILLPLLAITLNACGGSPSRQSLSRLDDTDGVASEQRFQDIINEVVGLYSADMEQEGAFLRLSVQWDDPEFRAYSAKSHQTWLLMLSGGLVQNQWSTEDGLRAIVCHEFGHFFGGGPQLSPGIAAEGQADFYAARTCMPRLWQETDNSGLTPTERNPDLPDEVKAQCASGPDTTPSGVQRCQRILRASWVAMSIASQRRGQTPPNYSSADSSVAPQTVLGYPSYQCRLDTYAAGALGRNRPACWFREEH